MSPTHTTARTRSNPQQKRAEILDQAMHIIGEMGYQGFTIQELAKRCRLSNAGLLHYFGSKDKLLVALLQDRDRRDAEAVISVVRLANEAEDLENSTVDMVRKALCAIVKRNATEPELVRLYTVLSAEALCETHPARDYFLEREAATLALFTRMLVPHVSNPESTARQVLALLSGIEAQWLRAGQGFDLVGEWDRCLALLLPAPANRQKKRGMGSGKK